MKKLYFFTFLIFFSITSVFSQATDYITGLDDDIRLLLVGDILYFSQDNSISYVDITLTNPIPTELISGLNNPLGMEYKDGLLYVAVFDGGDVKKIDLSSSTPTLIDITSSGITPNEMILEGNNLYYSDNNGDRIYKYNIIDQTNIADLVLNTPGFGGPIGIEVKDDFLYFTMTQQGKLFKLDLNSSDNSPIEILSGLSQPIGLKFKGDFLYIAEYSVDRVSRVNTFQTNPIRETVVSNLNSPIDITFNDDIMYISQESKISTYDVSLSIPQYEQKILKVFPNPTKDILQLSNLKDDAEFIIHDINGRKLLEGVIAENEQLDIASLSEGHYFITVSSSYKNETLKFVKN